jgi:hypothetical protein
MLCDARNIGALLTWFTGSSWPLSPLPLPEKKLQVQALSVLNPVEKIVI